MFIRLRNQLAIKKPRRHVGVGIFDNYVDSLKEFSPYSSSYVDVLTPNELGEVVGTLNLLRQRNRPDFEGVEEDILTTLEKSGTANKTAQGAIKRARGQRQAGRKGMQWDTLTSLAAEANRVWGEGPSFVFSDNSYEYTVPIDQDPDYNPEKQKQGSVDLRPVYQFVATSAAFKIMANRSAATYELRKETYRKNAEIINQWYAEVEDVIGR